MPLSRARDYLSIGEVLDAIRDDFPDVSISKIRFLEAEGLISPERTGSGYRKFYEGDVARLRYILSLQRDQFLPLRVIRDRLAEADADGGVYPATESAPAPAAVPPSAETAAATGMHMDRAELQSAAALSDEELRGLVDFGVLGGSEDDVYDEHDLTIARAAKRFFQYGVEPRHLRMYRQFAEREAAFFEQIVTPVARKRDPEGRRQASRSMHELVGLGRLLREGILRSGLRGLL